MFDNKINLDIEEFLPTGLYLNMEERSILKASLSALQFKNNFSSVSFQGKIFGSGCDYYIACSRGTDFIRNKRFFYSMDGYFWRFLLPPSGDKISDFLVARLPFTGDPTHLHRGDGRRIREEARLSATVHLMDWETAIGPVESLQIDRFATGIIKENPYFKKLEDPTNLKSYVHHRLPRDQVTFVANENLCTAAGDAAVEFLEHLGMDEPVGCWKLRDDPVHGVVRLHCLLWPGHSFYYHKNSGSYGWLYLGLGDRNNDLPSMLGQLSSEDQIV